VPSGLGVTDAAAATYVGLLDRVVEDRQVTVSEVEALTLFAQACGISRSIARQLHLAYLTHMWQLAAADDVITEGERTDLEQLATLLSVALPR
jgi:DNA polymerase-3 subunit epsilon